MSWDLEIVLCLCMQCKQRKTVGKFRLKPLMYSLLFFLLNIFDKRFTNMETFLGITCYA
jgi:hypothetical protein